MSTRHLAFWLIPAPEEAVVLQTMIEELANRYDAPIFKPHLTLYSGQFEKEETPLTNLPTIEPISLPVLGVDATTQYTKTLFLRFPRDEGLLALMESLREQCPSTGYSLDPHLSLLYADLPLSEKRNLAKNLFPPLAHVRFTSLSVIEHPEIVATKRDVEAFRELSS